MKVFTFFYNRFDSATTSLALGDCGIEHTVLIHNEKDLAKFIEGGVIHPLGMPVVTDNPKGLAYQRNSALDLMEEGEWAVFMCDDFQKVESYPKEWIFSKTQKLDINFENQSKFAFGKEHEITLAEMFTYFPTLIQLAENNGVHLVGFGLTDNPINMGRKFSTKGLADGRFWLVKKSHYKFDLNTQLVDDVSWTAENIVRHGKVLILNWCVPHFSRYTKGGFGSKSERMSQREKECRYLVNKFSPLVKFADKAGWDYGTHIRLYASKNNIEEARKRVLRN